MQGAIHQDLTAAANALDHALDRVNFLVIASELKEVETLAPEKFLGEVMNDITLAVTKIQCVSEHYVCSNGPEARA